MDIQVTLNSKATVLQASPQDSLLTVLRERGFIDLKCGCNAGTCGSCVVLLDDLPVPSCQVKVALVQGCDIVTYGHFFLTDFYTDIKQGFDMAGIQLCGFCDAGKIFFAYQVLKMAITPSREELLTMLRGIDYCCVDTDSYIEGIMFALANNHARMNAKDKKLRRTPWTK